MPLAGAQHHQAHPPVFGGQQRVDRPGAGPDLGGLTPRGHGARHVGHRPVGDLGGGLVGGHVDELAGPSLAALKQGADGGESPDEGGDVAGEVAGGHQRRPLGQPGLPAQTGGGVDHRPAHVPAGVGAGAAVGGDGDHRQVRVAGGDGLGLQVSKAGGGPGAGLGRVDQHVGGGQQLVEPLGAVGGVQIDDGAELAAVAHGEEQGVVAVEGRETAAGRARRRLRLHHLGPQVGQQPAAQLAEVDGQVDHPEAGQRSYGHGPDVRRRRRRAGEAGARFQRPAAAPMRDRGSAAPARAPSGVTSITWAWPKPASGASSTAWPRAASSGAQPEAGSSMSTLRR